MSIEEQIAQANPVPHGSLPGPDSAPAREALARILRVPAPHHRRPERRGASRIRPRIALGAAAAAGAIAIVLTQVLPGSPARPSRPGRPARTVAAVLDALAVAAAAQPAEHPPGPGQYQYTDSASLSEVDTAYSPKIYFRVMYRQHRQIWIGYNGSGRIAETNRDPRFVSPKDRAAWIAAGRPTLLVPRSDSRFGPHQLSDGPRNLLTLTTNPARLYALLTERRIEGGPPGPAEDFVQIGDLLRETDAPPALRATIFTVAKRIPGVRLLGTVTDQAGRRGVALAYVNRIAAKGRVPAQLDTSVLIFDPKTSKLLAEQTSVTDARTRKTSLTSWTVYYVSGVVNSVTSTAPVTGHGRNGSGPA